MVRVVAPGGTVAAYAWDIMGGGFTLQPIQTELKAMGFTPTRPPNSEASTIVALQKLWTDAGLVEVETRRIDVQRSFVDFEDFWGAVAAAPTLGSLFASMTAATLAELKARVRTRVNEDTTGRITCAAWANAIKGRLPAR
jgi:hypothetical protein